MVTTLLDKLKSRSPLHITQQLVNNGQPPTVHFEITDVYIYIYSYIYIICIQRRFVLFFYSFKHVYMQMHIQTHLPSYKHVHMYTCLHTHTYINT